MKLKLGYDSQNVKTLLTRWGAELRSRLFLEDEDLEWTSYEISASDLSTSTVGVTFSGVDVVLARYLHRGKICFWEVDMTFQGSADHADIIIPRPPPVSLRRESDPFREKVYGHLTAVRGAAFGATTLRSALIARRLDTNDFRLQVLPSLSPAVTIYTNAGIFPCGMYIGGEYATRDFPVR